MKKSHVIALVVVAALLGAAYGDKIPVFNSVYPKLPGSRA